MQNSADAYIKNPIDGSFKIDINVDVKNKKIIFFDNGHGIEEKDFISKMTSIGVSDKGKAIDQIGFRGIGRLAAMPFCSQLVFNNKTFGSNKIQRFIWNGEMYNQLLAHAESDDLKKAIEQITTYETIEYDGAPEDHFFKVELINYTVEIEELIKSKDFKTRLCRLLPLKYSIEFDYKDEIHKHYQEFMNSSLEKFEFDVFLNGDLLYKPYTNSNILESDIVFWDLSFKKVSEQLPEEKIGVLWFTFNRRVNANPIDSSRGIYVRSKNMLLGNEYAIADAVANGNNEYVATYRELTQTLNGVYGELLIDTSRLSDNARRDWFRIDAPSNELKFILTDYLRKLKTYRYAASQAFHDQQTEAKREKVIQAYSDLTKGFDLKSFEKDFYNNTKNPRPTVVFNYADDDIPRYSITLKRFYEDILLGIKEYYSTSSDEGIENFIKLRTFLKQYFNQKS